MSEIGQLSGVTPFFLRLAGFRGQGLSVRDRVVNFAANTREKEKEKKSNQAKRLQGGPVAAKTLARSKPRGGHGKTMISLLQNCPPAWCHILHATSYSASHDECKHAGRTRPRKWTRFSIRNAARVLFVALESSDVQRWLFRLRSTVEHSELTSHGEINGDTFSVSSNCWIFAAGWPIRGQQ